MFQQALDDILPLDNATVVDFLSSTASILAEEGLLVSKEVDNFRLCLSSIQGCKDERQQPLMEQLIKQDAEFLRILQSRYGVSHLAANLWRYSLRQALGGLVISLSQWGCQLVQKSKLLFNRPFHLYENGRCERRVLYGTILVDLTAVLDLACGKLCQLLEDLAHYHGHDMASADSQELAVDHKIAKALGFAGALRRTIPGVYERLAQQALAPLIQTVLGASLEINQHLHFHSPGNDESVKVAVLGEWLAMECSKMAAQNLPAVTNLAALDTRRRILLSSLYGVRHGFDELAVCFDRALTQHQQLSLVGQGFELPQDVRRRLTFDLIAAGIPVRKAELAVADLLKYLQRKQIAAKDLLVGELNKINPCLTPRCLKLLQDLGEETPLAKVPLSEKQSTLRQSETLLQRFSVHLQTLGGAVLACLLLILSQGCGLKLAPDSERLDYRPDIPFRETSFSEGGSYKAWPLPAGPHSGKSGKTGPTAATAEQGQQEPPSCGGHNS